MLEHSYNLLKLTPARENITPEQRDVDAYDQWRKRKDAPDHPSPPDCFQQGFYRSSFLIGTNSIVTPSPISYPTRSSPT